MKILPVDLQKLVDSQITRGDHMQRGIHYLAETFQKAIYYPFENSEKVW